MNKLEGKKVAVLVTDGFEQSEFTEPKKALENSGATVHVICPHNSKVKAWNDGNWGDEFQVDKKVDEVRAEDYNGLVLPGGVINPDKLRRDSNSVRLVKDFFRQHKPVAAICHGPQLLIEADVVKDRKLTSFESIKKDLQNAGANWVNEEVVVDSGLTTSRNPDDLPAFCNKMVEELAEGKHEEQVA